MKTPKIGPTFFVTTKENFNSMGFEEYETFVEAEKAVGHELTEDSMMYVFELKAVYISEPVAKPIYMKK